MKCTDMYRDVACVHKAASILERPRLYEDAKLVAWRYVKGLKLEKAKDSPMVKSGMAFYSMPDSREAGIERVTKRLHEEGLLRREGDMLVPTEAGRAWREGYDLWLAGGSKYPPGRAPDEAPPKERPVSPRRDYNARLDRGVEEARRKLEYRLPEIMSMPMPVQERRKRRRPQ